MACLLPLFACVWPCALRCVKIVCMPSVRLATSVASCGQLHAPSAVCERFSRNGACVWCMNVYMYKCKYVHVRRVYVYVWCGTYVCVQAWRERGKELSYE